MKAVMFFAPGVPKGQPRPRAFKLGDKIRVYDPATAEGWKSAIASAAKAASLPHEMFTGPVKLTITLAFPRPKSHFRSNGLLKPGSPSTHIHKPDADNAAKAVMDALSVIGFWKDDAQVAYLTVIKTYPLSNEEHVGAWITIEDITPMDEVAS